MARAQCKLFFAEESGYPEMPAAPADGATMRWFQSFLAIPGAQRPWMRTYSIRRHLADRQQIEIDFVLHGGHGGDGPASSWAATASVGDELGMVGPAQSHFRTPANGAWKLFVGDETALPALGATLESLEPQERAVAVIEVVDAAERQDFATLADVTVRWVHRGGPAAGRADGVLDAVREVEIPDGPVFAWVAGEASLVRTVRCHLVGERGIDKRAVAFAGYWRVDMAQDDAPTDEELAEAGEYVS
ncbi:siderophore-interacting protein [Pseudonocardia sp. GCM10023141]|uniref:siderophore-interacting protein n=1 Tax=Pseudonocardia sp. GCM10023141 TaxID=3252653 RepID=UPI0036141711